MPLNLPWKWIGLGAVGVFLFLWGAFVGSAHIQNKWNADKEVQRFAVMAQLDANAAKVQEQIRINHDIGAKYATLQADNASANERLHALLRLYAAKTRPVPGAPPRPAGAVDDPEGAGCTLVVSDLVERASVVFDAARSDATQLSSLQAWVIANALD